ncbi:hypothetical protein, partial [Prevotella denticola]|uniref:hypothetical protein n=1 Tax=Prevotella denticola TaxID=28129 RepID=UPI00242BF61E
MPAAVIDNVSGLVNQDQAGGVRLDTTRSVRRFGKVEFVGFLFFSYICSPLKCRVKREDVLSRDASLLMRPSGKNKKENNMDDETKDLDGRGPEEEV